MSEKMITLEELHAAFENLSSKEVILDVRSPAEWARGHIPGSLNIPHEEVAGHSSELKKYSKIFIHCQMGGRAKMALEKLKGQGLGDLMCLGSCGMAAWMEKGYETQREEA